MPMPRHLVPVLALVLLSACERPFPAKPLPELVAASAPTTALAVPELLLAPGEKMIWDVYLQGLTIGRAELVVGTTDVNSRFRTNSLASSFASARHELATTLDRRGARPRSGSETLELDGETRQISAAFDGASYTLDGKSGPHVVPGGSAPHTMHSALGVLRAWARPKASPGFLYILQLGHLYQLDVARPVTEDLRDTKTFRIDGEVRRIDSPSDSIALTLWLAANRDRTPLRIVITTPNAKITAELIESTASFE
jgi:hypothetical protein